MVLINSLNLQSENGGCNAGWLLVFASSEHMVDVAQLVRALDCGSRGRGFESHLPPETKNRFLKRFRFYFTWAPEACFCKQGKIKLE